MRHDYIGTEHLLAGLLAEEDGIGAEALNHAGVELESVRGKIESIAGRGEEEAEQPAPFTPRSKKVLELSLREALQLRHNYIGTEHILLGLLRENEGVAARILSDLGVDPDKVRGETVHRIGREPQRATYQPPSPLQGERPLTAGSLSRSSLTKSLRMSRAHLGIESRGESRDVDLNKALNSLQSPPLIWMMDVSKTYRKGKADEESGSLTKVVAVDTRMSASELLRYIQGIEAILRRADGERGRRVKRTRIHLLLYERDTVDEPHLTVPHSSLLLPHNLKGLADIAPEMKIPEVTVEALVRAVDLSGVREADEGM